MSDVHEQMEVAEHAKHAAQDNKHVALLIAILALFLALSEMLAKSANTEALILNIKVSDTWNFFQAKSIRRTVVLTAADEMKVGSVSAAGDAKSAMDKQIAAWQETAARYQSEPKPEGGEGTRELFERAKEGEHERDIALARYHNYEFASAAFQIGIVLCSAAIITGVLVLAWAAGGIAVIGLVFISFGLFAPHLLHLG
ncbi:MAG: DUF4337 domain-containing protein [Bradyrhizobiaceae bacterium]|nr:DUF4337 domain-containing protein [Bradyrhizobiaceae bacterium]